MRFAVCAPLLLLFLRCAAAVSVAAQVELHPSSSWITYGSPPKGSAAAAAAAAADFSVHRHVSRQLSRGHYERDLSPSQRPVVLDDLSTTTRSDGKLSNFRITVVDKPPSMDALPAIRLAAAIVEHSWPSKVPVNMRIAFAELGGHNVLANGGGAHFARMRTIFNEIVPVAAAESFLGRDLNRRKKGTGKFDVLITVNTNTHWYLGTDGRPPRSQYDLATVLLHEIYHNLIFTGGIFVEVSRNPNVDGGVYQEANIRDNFITRFDSFLATKDGCAVLGYLHDKKLQRQSGRSGSELLAQAVVNDSLYFGFHAFGVMVKLHAPRVFRAKSSIYHIDPHTAGADAMMSPHIKPGNSQHQIGPTILKMQALFLNPQVKGANPNCPRPLHDPAPVRQPTPDERTGVDIHHDKHRDQYEPPPLDKTPLLEVKPKGLSTAVVITLAVLGGLLLLGLLLTLIFVLLYICKPKPPPKYPTEPSYRGPSEPPCTMTGPTVHPPHGSLPPRPMPCPPPPVKKPSHSSRTSYMREPSYKPPSRHSPTVHPPCPPSRHSTSHRDPSCRPSSSSNRRSCPPPCPRPPPSTKPPSTHRHSNGSRHSHRHSHRPGSHRPSSRVPSARSPKTEDYFDCA